MVQFDIARPRRALSELDTNTVGYYASSFVYLRLCYLHLRRTAAVSPVLSLQ